MASNLSSSDPPDDRDQVMAVSPSAMPQDEVNRGFNDRFNEAQEWSITKFRQDFCFAPEAMRQRPARLYAFNTLLSRLLIALVEADSLLDRSCAQEDKAVALLDPPYSELYPVLVGAALSGDWSAVRAFPALQAPQMPSDLCEIPDADTKLVWGTQFIGNYHKRVLDMLNDMNHSRRRDTMYSNLVHIVQSSGMGKSRTMDEVAGLVVTIPLCLRRGANNGYPGPADETVFDWLCRPFDGQSRMGLAIRHMFFLAVLFLLVAKRMEELVPPVSEGQGTNTALALKWRQYLLDRRGEMRRKLYKEVTRTTDSILDGWNDSTAEAKMARLLQQLSDTTSDIQSEFEALLSAIGNSFRKNMSSASSYDRYMEVNRRYETAGKIVRVAASSLLSVINRRTPGSSQRDIQFLITIDESQALFTDSEEGRVVDQTAPGPFEPYNALCMALDGITISGPFAVFLSKGINLVRPEPPRPFSASAQIRQSVTYYGPAPITELPFDIWGDDGKIIIAEGTMKLEKACEPGVMVRFGRPLWWTHWHNERYQHSGYEDAIFDFAHMKLAAERSLDTPVYRLTDAAQLAIAGVRLLFNLQLGSAKATYYDKEMIEKHMRVLYSVPEHREYLRSGTPSEPVLAEASARWMNMQEFYKWACMLANRMTDGTIETTQAIKLTARLILTMAHDTAVKRLMFKRQYPLGLNPEELKGLVDEASKEELWYLQWDIGIPLDEFLTALLGDDHAAQVWASFPDNVPQARGKPFGEVFANARIRFSHFVQAYDTTVISDDAMWAALARGMAYQCPTNHKAIDIMIPVLLRDENLSRHVVTAIFIRVNDRWDEPKPMINAESLGFFTTADADGSSLTRPYITMLMDLGGRQSHRMFTEDPFKRPGSTPSSEDPSHHRYSFVIKGCSPSVYPYVVLDQSTEHYFAYLLRHGAMMDEHPRQKALSSVTQLKPFWSSNLNSFSWAGGSRDSHTASGSLSHRAYVESREGQREEASDKFEILSFAGDEINELS